MLFFMMGLLPPTDIQRRALRYSKVNQVGLPTCCFGIQLSLWENCQLFSYSIFQENIVQQKPIKFQSSQSTKQTLSLGETQLYLSSQLEETHYQCVNMNSSRK